MLLKLAGSTLPLRVLVPPIGWRYNHEGTRPGIQGRDKHLSPHAHQRGPYLGSLFIAHTNLRYQIWDRARLRWHANYWTQTLSTGDRAAWATFAAAHPITTETYSPRTMSALRAFLFFNKIQGPAITDSLNPNSLITTIPQPLAPASYTPPTAPTISGATLTSGATAPPLLCQLELSGATAPYDFRLDARPLNTRAGFPPRAPLLAIATGVATQTPSESWVYTAPVSIGTLESIASGIRTYSVTATFGGGPGQFSPATVDIRTHPGTSAAWLTINPPAGFVAIDQNFIRKTAVTLPLTVTFTMTIDYSLLNPPTSINAIEIDTRVDSPFTEVTGETFTDPSGATYAVPNQLSTDLLRLLDVQINNETAPTIADFTAAWLRLFGPALPGDNLAFRIRGFDNINGTPGTPASAILQFT